ncbi:MAG: S8 family serine peptidase [Sphingomonas sp.]
MLGGIGTGTCRIAAASRDVAGNSSIDDEGGHGTAVAFTIAGRRNDAGTHGVAFDAQLVIARADSPGAAQHDQRRQRLPSSTIPRSRSGSIPRGSRARASSTSRWGAIRPRPRSSRRSTARPRRGIHRRHLGGQQRHQARGRQPRSVRGGARPIRRSRTGW